MKSHFFKRIILLIPSIFAISIIIFILKQNIPNDIVEQTINFQSGDSNSTVNIDEATYKTVAKELGLDKPQFYFSITPSHYPDTLNYITNYNNKRLAKSLLKSSCDWNAIQDFINDESLTDPKNISFRNTIISLVLKKNYQSAIKQLKEKNYSTAAMALTSIAKNKSALYVFPKIKWSGINNQYHQWIANLFSLQTRSIIDGQLTVSKISSALLWTISLSILSLIFSYGIGLFIGLMSHISSKQIWKYLQLALDTVYSLPLFWFGTLLVVFFTTSHYGKFLHIFPSPLDADFAISSGSLLKFIQVLLLPCICISLHSAGYISALLSSNLSKEMNAPYITTARQKGLTQRQVIINHAFKNAAFPLVTIFTNSLPSIFTGSLITEVIFNIPGIGRLIYKSILLSDWNILLPCILLIAIVTMVSYLLADVLYEKIDPRLN